MLVAAATMLTACEQAADEGSQPFASRYTPLPSDVVILQGATVLTGTGERLDNAPTMNDYFGMSVPPMLSSRAFGIHKAAVDKHPDRFEKLQSSFRKVFDDPAFKEAYLKAKGNWEYVNYGGVEECATFKASMLELGEQYKSFLTGS